MNLLPRTRNSEIPKRFATCSSNGPMSSQTIHFTVPISLVKPKITVCAWINDSSRDRPAFASDIREKLQRSLTIGFSGVGEEFLKHYLNLRNHFNSAPDSGKMISLLGV